MKSRRNRQFRATFALLWEDVKRQARAAYLVFRENPQHPGLQFKRVHATREIYSVRIGLHYRALGVRRNDEIVWFWIGHHSVYDRILSHL